MGAGRRDWKERLCEEIGGVQGEFLSLSEGNERINYSLTCAPSKVN